MNSTMIIAQLLLPVFAAVTISLFINPKWYKQMAKEIADSPSMVYLLSVIKLIFGTAIVLYHNIWGQDWATIISLIGWVSMIKGIVYILFPKVIKSAAGWAQDKTTLYVAAVICGIITVTLFSLSGLR